MPAFQSEFPFEHVKYVKYFILKEFNDFSYHFKKGKENHMTTMLKPLGLFIIVTRI